MDQNLKKDEEIENRPLSPEAEEEERQRILAQYICYPDWKMSLIAVAVIGIIYLLLFC